MAVLRRLKSALRDLSTLIWPDQCLVCGAALSRGEEIMCTACRHDMPRCRIHLSDFTPVHRRLLLEGRIERAASWFHYHRSSPYTRLIHEAKYHGRPDIIESLGRDFAREIMPDGFFADIDLIVPVPLHPRRERQRGYNQSLYLARGIASATGLPVGELLRRVGSHTSQTRRSIFARWSSTRHDYEPLSPSLAGRVGVGLHLLLVDDVCTTGATLTACAAALRRAYPTARISILTLALAALD